MSDKYDVLLSGEWCKCWRAIPVKRGWLHFQMRGGDNDGLNGLAKPGEWRVRPVKASAVVEATP